MKILIVDDSSSIIQLVAILLEEYDTTFARSGEDALSMIEYEAFDLILLDVMMPGIDGFETCIRLREVANGKNVPVVFLTAKDDDESLEKGFEVGGQDYITKPFKNKEFLARVKNNLLLGSYQKTLKQQVEAEKDKSEAKDLLLFEQSKMAQMGESFSMLIHQLKQPLNAITTASASIKIDNELGVLKNEAMIRRVSVIENSANHLSNTMDEFSDFFKEEKKSESISVKTLINKTLHLNAQIMKAHLIKFMLEIENDDFTLFVRINEMIQVLLVLMQNSVDNFVEKGMPGSIKIEAKQETENTIIVLSDDGGGIEASIIEKIFDLHFSTKGKGGSGIGLYMVKRIICNHLGGDIEASNIKGGVAFTITLPNKKI